MSDSQELELHMEAALLTAEYCKKCGYTEFVYDKENDVEIYSTEARDYFKAELTRLIFEAK